MQNGVTFPPITGELILIKILCYLQLNESIQMKIGVNTVFIEIKSSFNNIWLANLKESAVLLGIKLGFSTYCTYEI